MRTLILTLCGLFALAMSLQARGAEGTSVHAILVIASSEKAPADPRLAPYEANLQRNLPESSFRLDREGRATLGPKMNHATIGLGAHRLELEGGTRDTDGIRLKFRWLHGNATVIGNTFSFQPGVPFVLVSRPSHDGNVPMVIIIAE